MSNERAAGAVSAEAHRGRASLPPDPAGWGALADLYHRYLTGLLLALVTRVGSAAASEVVFHTFRRQHLEQFLPGLRKLELDQLPPAVACARYHVLSNALGGVRVVWIPESDTKSWVRYLPPRWIFDGTALCAIPTDLSRAMLRGWHGHNGVSLGNDRLGFVCTMQTTDVQPGLEGYYIEEEAALPAEERVRFRPGERPVNDPVPLALPAWGPDRLAKVERNYASNYIRTILPVLCSVLGPGTAAAVGQIAARQIGMQYHQAVMARLGATGAEPAGDGAMVGEETGDRGQGDDPGFAGRLARLLAAHGSEVTVDAAPDGEQVVRMRDWRLFDGVVTPPEVFEAWNGLWEGLAAMEDLRLWVTARADLGQPAFEWRIRPTDARPAPAQ